MKIVDNRRATDREWNTIWGECDEATYFHSCEWADIWSRYTKDGNRPYNPDPRLIIFSDGKKALLPLSSIGPLNSPITSYISSPAGTFGGWISTDELDVEHAELLTQYFLEEYTSLTWLLNPYDTLSIKLAPANATPETTATLPLNEDFDVIFRRWSKGHKAAVTQARKHGVQISRATSVEQWKEYFEVYLSSIERWGDKVSSKYEWKLFEEMFNKSSDHIVLWIAQKDENLIAGALCFYAKNHVVYWHGAALEDYFKMRPVNLMIYEAIKDAHINGFKWFDFNPSGDHKGVKAFKKSFGTIDKDCPVVITRPYRPQRGVLNKILGKIVKIKHFFFGSRK